MNLKTQVMASIPNCEFTNLDVRLSNCDIMLDVNSRFNGNVLYDIVVGFEFRGSYLILLIGNRLLHRQSRHHEYCDSESN